MAKKIINVGVTANDKSGDPLRTAFQKVNDNFTELYSALGIDGTVFDPLNVDSHLIPAQNNTYDIGSPSKQWRSMYVGLNTLYIDNVPISLDNNGNLTVNGDIVSGTGAVTTGATPPENPVTGQLWWDNVDTGRLYIYYNNSWVDASPIIGPNTGNWTFTGDTATVTGTTAQIGKNSSETITEETPGGTISQTTTNRSQVEIDANSIVITRNVTQVVDDGVIVTTDEAGAVASIGNGTAYLKTYTEPDGPNNTEYAEAGASGSFAYLESRQDNVSGYTLGGVVTSPGSVAITAHSTTDKTWLFYQDGNLTVPESSSIAGTNDFTITSESGDNSSGLFLNGNPLVGSAILYANNTATIRSDNNGIIKDWSFDRSGTITTPSLLPRSFTATVDSAHYSGEGSLTLEGDAWYFAVEFSINASGSVETIITNNTPWPSNPGYINNLPFAFTEADHGIPGYTFTLTLVDIQNPGPMMYTTNLTASIPPTLPSTIASPETIKLTADATSWTFSPDGNLTLPGRIIFPYGTASIYGNTDLIGLFPSPSSSSGLEIASGVSSNLFNAGNVVITSNFEQVGGAKVWTFDPTGDLTLPGSLLLPGNIGIEEDNGSLYMAAPNDIILSGGNDQTGSVFIKTNQETKEWEFGANGALTVPGTIQNSASTLSDLILTAQGTGLGGNALIRTLNGDYEWTFGNDGNLTLPGNINIGDLTIQEGFPGLTVATGNNLAIGTSRYDLVSADAFIGTGEDFVADIEFTDDIIAVQVGWILVGPDLPVSAVDASVGNQYRITVPGATFVTGTRYSFRNSTPTPHTWVFGNDGVLTTPGSGTISHQDNDLKLAVTGPTDVIVFRTAGGDVVVNSDASLTVDGGVNTTHINNLNFLNLDNSPIQVGQGGGGKFAVAMDRFQVVANPPTSSIGSDGDVIGCVAFSSSHIYYCTGLYDGVTNIWKRVAWSGDTW